MTLTKAPATPLEAPRPRVLHAVTASVGLGSMRGQLRSLREAGFLVLAASGPGVELESLHQKEGVPGFEVPLERGIAPVADPISLVKLWQLLWRFRPQITNVGTLKAGLLGKYPSLAPEDLSMGDPRFTVDFRSVYAGVLEHWLKTPSLPVLGKKFEPLAFV